jgi:alpha-D-ribose 1-methylphosphonate 5-triphosphate diphosphatase
MYVHARFEVTNPDTAPILKDLLERKLVQLVSIMDHTPGQGQYRDLEHLRRRTAREQGLTPEEADLAVQERIAEKQRHAGDVAATLAAIARICALHGIPLASHDDDTVEKVALMESLGATISEFPVTPEAAAEARRRGLATAMGAPNALRGQSYSGNMSARDGHAAGLLDILAADYHPSAILPAILVLAGADPQGLAGATRLATLNPARALGLDDRGEIALDQRADLVVSEDTGVGHVRATFRGGAMIYSDGWSG